MEFLFKLQHHQVKIPPFVAKTVHLDDENTAENAKTLPGWTLDDMEVRPTWTLSLPIDLSIRDVLYCTKAV